MTIDLNCPVWWINYQVVVVQLCIPLVKHMFVCQSPWRLACGNHGNAYLVVFQQDMQRVALVGSQHLMYLEVKLLQRFLHLMTCWWRQRETHLDKSYPNYCQGRYSNDTVLRRYYDVNVLSIQIYIWWMIIYVKEFMFLPRHLKRK